LKKKNKDNIMFVNDMIKSLSSKLENCMGEIFFLLATIDEVLAH